MKIAPIPAAAAATAVLLAGCGTGSADEPAPEQAAGDVAVVDASTLDTGGFRTTPQAQFTTIGDDFRGSSTEGQRMAEYVVNPIEIDPQLTDLTAMSTYVIKDSKSLSILLPGPTPAGRGRQRHARRLLLGPLDRGPQGRPVADQRRDAVPRRRCRSEGCGRAARGDDE
ncbi:hypothetical protein IM877_15955 [Rhodococcus sp. GG48]|nr:hypothetical protein [Rhodococcus sp. GG48]